LKRSIGYAFLRLAFILAAIAYAYIFITRRREKRRENEKDVVEAVIRILKEAKKIQAEIEKRGEDVTSGAEIILSRIAFRIDGLRDRLDAGVNGLKSLMLFGIGIILALAIISMMI
jgi:Flp pilus assembly protein TadB